MTETPRSSDTDSGAKAAANSAGNLWTDIGPVLLYVIVYNVLLRLPEGNELFNKETALYWATGIFFAAIIGVIGWTLAQGRRIPPMLLITGVVVGVFFAIGLALQDKQFLKIKPTIINLLFAGTILGSLAIGRNIWKTAFEHAFKLPDHAWKVFALRWAGFYVFLAGLNEVIWRNFSEEFWINSKVFLLIPVSIGFMLLNLPFLMKHQIIEDDAANDQSGPDA